MCIYLQEASRGAGPQMCKCKHDRLWVQLPRSDNEAKSAALGLATQHAMLPRFNGKLGTAVPLWWVRFPFKEMQYLIFSFIHSSADGNARR